MRQTIKKNDAMKKTRQFILGLALTLFSCLNAIAQQPDFLFEHLYPYPLFHTLFYQEGVEVVHLEIAPNAFSEGFYLVAASDSKSYFYYETDSIAFPPLVYKVSLDGEILGELALGYEDRYASVVRLFEDPDNPQCCLAIGVTHDNDLHCDRPFMAKFDHDLNLLWQKEIELPELYHETMFLAAIMDSGGDIVCCLAVNGLGAVFCRMTTEGEMANIVQYPGPCNTFNISCGNLFEFQDGSGDYGLVMEYMEDVQMERYIVRINRDMQLVSNTPIPHTIYDFNSSVYFEILLSVDFVYTSFPLPDGSMVLAGNGLLTRIDYQNNHTHDEVVGLMRFDHDGNLVSYSSVGQDETGPGNDSIKAIQGTTCVDFVGADAFYFYYTVGQPNGTGYDWMNCFVVTKMDFDGNVIWQRYWDRYYPEYDMKVYYPNFLTTTSDDGCLVSGYCYYSDIYGSNRFGSDPEIFMLKFFSDGTLSIPEAEAFVRPYMFYPNPVQDELHLQYSPDVMPTQIELYDLQGRLVKIQRNGLEHLEMNGLPAGTYTMRVTLEGGKVFSDKVVKE